MLIYLAWFKPLACTSMPLYFMRFEAIVATRRPYMYKKLLLALCAFCLSTTVNAADLQGRIDSLERLLTVSSAAKKITSSQNQDAKDMLQEAHALREKAITSLQNGNKDIAEQSMSEAMKKLFAASKLADGGNAAREKNKTDNDERKKSITALLKQYRSVAEEKKLSAEAEVVEADVLSEVAHAEALATEGKHKESRSVLDKAYQKIKTSLVKLRNGEELINALVFETPKDEYQYYVAKIASQMKAITIFSEKISSPGKQKTIDRILTSANKDQASAQSKVDANDYEAALPHMDKALNKLRSGLMMIVN